MSKTLGIQAGPTEIILMDKGMRASNHLWAMVSLRIANQDELMRAFGYNGIMMAGVFGFH